MDDGWMVDFCEFSSFSTVYQSFQDIKRLNFGLPMWNITRVAVAGPLKTSNSKRLLGERRLSR